MCNFHLTISNLCAMLFAAVIYLHWIFVAHTFRFFSSSILLLLCFFYLIQDIVCIKEFFRWKYLGNWIWHANCFLFFLSIMFVCSTEKWNSSCIKWGFQCKRKLCKKEKYTKSYCTCIEITSSAKMIRIQKERWMILVFSIMLLSI